MDSTDPRVSLDELADAVVAKLTQSGRLADLGQVDLDTLEDEVLGSIDQLTRDVISQLLGKQAQDTEKPHSCPRCNGRLSEKPPQARCLQSRRGDVKFKCDVYRCETCRLDFFPSVQNARL